MTAREVWITAVGAVTAVGPDVSSLVRALGAGATGMRPLDDPRGVHGAPAPPAPGGGRAHLDRAAALFRAAAEEAWAAAGLDPSAAEAAQVIEGSSLGPLPEVLHVQRERLASGGRPVRPRDVLRFMPGAGGAAFAQDHGLGGGAVQLSAGSISGLVAAGEAFQKVAAGFTDLAFAGGADAPLRREVLEAFRLAGILSAPPEGSGRCRPYDPDRDGTLLGEGAAVLLLEASDHARRRGAEPLAVVRGYGAAVEAHSPIAPDPGGAAVRRAALGALRGADRPPGWIKVHGSGTRQGDAAECRGLAGAFGPLLPRLPLTALKSSVGHCLGASGAVEAVACVAAAREGFVPATVGTSRADPDLPRHDLVREARSAPPGPVLLLAESFGGRSAALSLEAVRAA